MIDILLAVLAGCVGTALAIGAYLWASRDRPVPYTPPPLPQMRTDDHEIEEVTRGMDDWHERARDAARDVDDAPSRGPVDGAALRDHLRRHMGER